MTTDRLMEFQMLAQTLHYGRAAEKLFLSQSVLSRHIQDMEKELGAQLFRRGPHGVSLTPAGAYLYRESLNYLQQTERAAERINSAGVGLAGSVRFGCLYAAMCAPIQNFLEYFEGAYPNILLTPEVIGSIPDSTELSNIHYLAVTDAVDMPHHFRPVKTFREKGVLVAPRSKEVRVGGTLSLAELEGETLFLPGHPMQAGSYAKVRQVVERAAGGRVRIIRVRNPETALMNVELGRGYTILPYHRMDELRYKSPTMAIADAECYFELLFYQNEAITDDPAALLFGREFLDRVQF